MSDLAPTSAPLRLAVIGGGVSGLAAAHRLRQLLPLADLRLFEASERLGGPLHTLQADGLVLEQGADSFLCKTPWALELCRELGLADQLIPTNVQHRRALVVHRGKLVPVPEGFVLMRPHQRPGILRSPVLSAVGKLRLLAEPWIRVPRSVHSANYDESVASFATRRLGRQAFERLVQPLVAGIYVADAAKLSLAATLPEFLEAERQHGSLWRSAQAASRNGAADSMSEGTPDHGVAAASGASYSAFWTLRGGLGVLVNAIAASLPEGGVCLKAPVSRLSRVDDHCWTLATKERVQDKPFDGVIVATPAPQTARLLDKTDPQLGNLLSRIGCASSAVVTVVYPRSHIGRRLDGFGFVVPQVEGRSIVAASFPGVKFPGRDSARLVPVRIFIGGALDPQVIHASNEELIAGACREMETLIAARGQPAATYVARWNDAMPQYHVGHLDLVNAIEHRTRAHRGLALAGNAYRGVGIPQCIQSGRTAAERLANELTKRE